MSRCDIQSFMVPDGTPYHASGAARAVHQCMTHGWTDLPTNHSDMLCPIGRIEQAVDDGLAKIAAAHKIAMGEGK